MAPQTAPQSTPGIDDCSALADPARLAVLDTNVVLALWLFRDPRCDLLHAAIAGGRVRPLGHPAIRAEIEDVLVRRPFGTRWHAGTDRVLAAWDACTTIVGQPAGHAAPHLRCDDPDDQKFIDLALGHRVGWLLSRDRAVLRLAARLRPFGVSAVPPERYTEAPPAGRPSASGPR